MKLKQFLLILQLKWTVCRRFFVQVPFPYVLLLSVMALLLGYVLLKMDISVTRQSIIGVVIIQFFLCSRINYNVDKRLFLKQYRGLYPLSVFIDSFLLSIPFVLVNGYLWMTAVIVAFLYSVLDLSAQRSVKFRPVLPSPFFMKSSYLWHAQQRYLLPVIWILIILIIVIAYLHDNYNLGIVVLGGGAFIGFLATILETEEADFVRMYLSPRHFVMRTLVETLYNTALYLFPLVVALFFLFPAEWRITEYSTGMLKKLHLLALLLQQNDLLLLDEPFNGLDILSSAYLSELLLELKKQETIILISSHDLVQLVKISDTLTVIENGTAYMRSEQLSDIQYEIERQAYDKVRSLNLSL